MFNSIETQGSLTKALVYDCVLTWMEALLIDRKARGLAGGTLCFYRIKQKLFRLVLLPRVIISHNRVIIGPMPKEHPTMTNEEHKAIVRRFIKAFAMDDQATLKEVVGGDYVAHAPGMPGPVDKETLLHRISMFNAAFSDLSVTIEDQIAEGDQVTTRITWRGTHTGNLQNLAPTGKQVEISALSVERIKDGKIVERWFNQDDLGLMRQLGVFPPQ
jgi:steroid delta-isomerase-like uncharacterized protein